MWLHSFWRAVLVSPTRMRGCMFIPLVCHFAVPTVFFSNGETDALLCSTTERSYVTWKNPKYYRLNTQHGVFEHSWNRPVKYLQIFLKMEQLLTAFRPKPAWLDLTWFWFYLAWVGHSYMAHSPFRYYISTIDLYKTSTTSIVFPATTNLHDVM